MINCTPRKEFPDAWEFYDYFWSVDKYENHLPKEIKEKTKDSRYVLYNPDSGEVLEYDEEPDIKVIHGFDKSERSGFKYWFAHWCSFQVVALRTRLWKPKYLLHDIEKPWLRLFMDYKKVQTRHRTRNRHHLEYGRIHGWEKVDWTALVIDWECGSLSKLSCPRDARQELAKVLKSPKWSEEEKDIIKKEVEFCLNLYKL